ncbi:MAG: hypothetical protein ACRCS9_02010 [Hyphomicrobium sp.]
MIELIVSVCLLSAPEQCKNVALSFAEDAVTPFQCMLYGQSEIAKWKEGHPDWSIRKWSCGPARQVANI